MGFRFDNIATIVPAMVTPPQPLRNMMAALVRAPDERVGETLSLAEQIALQIATDIVGGELAPRSRIGEVKLAERFMVSRGPVREALLMLDRTGLVQLLPRRGAVVTELSVKEVADLFEIRSVLFGLAARRLAEQRTDAAIAELRSQLQDLTGYVSQAEAKVAGDYVLAVQEFGYTICALSGIDELKTMVSRLFFRTLRYARLGLASEQRRRESLATWIKMVEQIERGDGDAAEASARMLVNRSREEAIRQLESQAISPG